MYQGDVGSSWEQLVHWKCRTRSVQDTKEDNEGNKNVIKAIQ
jgi:hypothetical protein